jgi:hypothetical protein
MEELPGDDTLIIIVYFCRFADDKESDEKGSSPELNFLHPDHAWLALGSATSSRRGSSQSEQLEVETYQLGRDFSRSLPGSRRSSFQSGQNVPEKGMPQGNVGQSFI